MSSPTSPEERIRELARKSAIDPADAARLLAAVRPAPVAVGRSFNPFTRFSPESLALAGLVGVPIWVAVARLGLLGDGALDVHIARQPIPFGRAALVELVDYVVLFGALALAARVFARGGSAPRQSFRPIELFATVGVARLVLVVVSLPMCVDGGSPTSALGWIALAISLAGWALHVTLYVFGLRTATSLRGGRLAGAVVASLLLAEVASKLVLATSLFQSA